MKPSRRTQRRLDLRLAALFALFSGALGAEDRVDYNRDVRPILSDNCYKCHGPDEKERKAGLRLDRREGAAATLASGARAVVPGKSAESALIARVAAADPDDRMPPASTGKTLKPEQVETLKRWIDQGAEYKGHWSFIPPARPPPPAVTRGDWARTPIDRFVLARLEREGLAPSPPADRATLLRRLSFDLAGLPPTAAEVDAFLADDSPEAVERAADRLLSSERFGEQMARYWLDLARYGDTHGLHFDNTRSIWKYREWVIRAFNRNQPFDRFITEQIAGDLLPDATLEQRIATGFNRCNVTTSEGGSIDDEVLVRYAVDRTETAATVFLGLTLGCAVCHDHKFDPVTQKEFYQLYAFFNGAADAAMDGNQAAPPPIIKVSGPEHEAELKRIDEQLAAARRRIDEALAKVEYQEPPAAAELAAEAASPKEHVWIEDEAPPGAQLRGDTPWDFVNAASHPVFSGNKATRRAAPALSQHFFEGASPGLKIGDGDKLFAYVYLDPADPPKSVMLQFNDGAWEHRAFWGEDLIPFGRTGTPGKRSMGALPKAGTWVRLEVDAAKVGLRPGAVLNGWAFTQYGGTVYWDRAGIVTRTPQDGSGFESQLAWEVYERANAKSSAPAPVKEALAVEAAKRTPEEARSVRDHFLERVYSKTRPIFDPLHKEVDDLQKRRGQVEGSIPTTLVMADMPQGREAFLLVRGAYDKKGEKVAPGTPAALPPMPEGAPRNRLGLAQWLVDPKHPLTARVAVNRFWQQLFGRGLVKTAEDFGSQGEWPTHPELLDWLAVEFVESGWNVKGLLKLIALSAVYQQSSNVTPELVARDPENALLARGPRFRLDAEVVRDAALLVSGLLVEQIGGPSVKPYQPPGLWEAVGFLGSDTREYKRDSGDALYRRSLYTFWKRTSPPASLSAFDAPTRETCVARRARTNTPLQALALMNDEQYVEAARCFAERLLREGGATPRERLSYGFRMATSRRPSDDELDLLERAHAEQRALFEGRKEAALALLSVGEKKRDESLDPIEHAAYTITANLLLNLDEAITKE